MMDDVKTIASFKNLDLGATKPTSVPMEVIHVEFTEDNLITSYASGFVKEAWRINPLKMEQIQLTVDEVHAYSMFLLNERIKSVNGGTDLWRRLKVFYIPAFIQYHLSLVGKVIVRDKGLTLIPVLADGIEVINFDQALEISSKIGSLENDLQILIDAMPRGEFGDADVMTTAMIAGYMRSIDKVEHVSATYAAAFMGMKIREEAMMSVLYRIQYDDIGYIATALMTQKGIY